MHTDVPEFRGSNRGVQPDGPERVPTVHPVRYNTAVLMDTDSVFSGSIPA